MSLHKEYEQITQYVYKCHQHIPLYKHCTVNYWLTTDWRWMNDPLNPFRLDFQTKVPYCQQLQLECNRGILILVFSLPTAVT